MFAEVLRFTEDDLLANQNGRLTASQKARLRWYAQQRVVRILAMPYITTGLCAFWTAYLLLSGRGLNFSIVMLLGLLGASLFVSFSQMDWWQAVQTEIKEARVDSAEGVVTRVAAGRPIAALPVFRRYGIWIADDSFDLPQKLYHAFEDEGRYAVYFTPQSRTLVSVEKFARQ